MMVRFYHRIINLVAPDRFTRNVGVLTSGTLLVQLIQTGTLLLAARLFSPTDFSIAAIYTALISIAMSVASASLHLSIPLASQDRDALHLLAASLLMALILALGLGVASWFIPVATVQKWTHANFLPYVALIAPGVALGSAYSTLQMWFVRRKKFALVAANRVSRSVGGAAAQLLLGLWRPSALGLIVGQIFYLGLGAAGLAARLWREEKAQLRTVRLKGLWHAALENRAFVGFTSLESLFSIAATQLPIVLIATRLKGDEPGYLALAMMAMGAPMALLGTGVTQAFSAELQEKFATAVLPQFTRQVMRRLCKYAACLFAFLVLAGLTLFEFIFGSPWHRSGELMAWMAPWFFLQLISAPLTHIFYVRKQQATALLLQVAALFIRCAAVMAAIHYTPHLAAESYALSGMVVYAMSALIILRYTKTSAPTWTNNFASRTNSPNKGHIDMNPNAMQQRPAPLERPRICSLTVLDDTDPHFSVDASGVCRLARVGQQRLAVQRSNSAASYEHLTQFAQEAARRARGREYDCLVGVSGGIDSSYTLLLLKRLGMRPLAIHVDNGWNSVAAQTNMRNLASKLHVDLINYTIDWDAMRDMQRALFRASVPDVEVATDHAVVAVIHHEAARRKIKTIVVGVNPTTESVMPSAWSYSKKDAAHLRKIHRRYGEGNLRNFPFLEPWQQWYYRNIIGMRSVAPLAYIHFNKGQALAELQYEVGYMAYGNKHCESTFTRFFQEYYLPEKFHIDKRKAHLSSLILAGEVTREQALQELKKPLFAPEEKEALIDTVVHRLGFSREAWGSIMAAPPARHENFPGYYHYWKKLRRWGRSNTLQTNMG